jgi:hypothetical protein
MTSNIENIYIDTRNRLIDSVSTSDFNFKLNNDRVLKYVNKITLLNHNINFNDQYLINKNNNIIEVYYHDVLNPISQTLLINTHNGVKSLNFKKQIITIEPGNYNLELLGQKIHIFMREHTDNFEVIKYIKDTNSFEFDNLNYYQINNESVINTLTETQIIIKDRFISAFKKYLLIDNNVDIIESVSVPNGIAQEIYFSNIITLFQKFYNEPSKMLETPVDNTFNNLLNNFIKYIVLNNDTYNIIPSSLVEKQNIIRSKLITILNSLNSTTLTQSSLDTITALLNASSDPIDPTAPGNGLTSISLTLDATNTITKVIYDSIYSIDTTSTLSQYDAVLDNNFATDAYNLYVNGPTLGLVNSSSGISFTTRLYFYQGLFYTTTNAIDNGDGTFTGTYRLSGAGVAATLVNSINDPNYGSIITKYYNVIARYNSLPSAIQDADLPVIYNNLTWNELTENGVTGSVLLPDSWYTLWQRFEASIYSHDPTYVKVFGDKVNNLSLELYNALVEYQNNVNSTDILVITNNDGDKLNFDVNMTNIYKEMLLNFSCLSNYFHNDFDTSLNDDNGKYFFIKFGLTNSNGEVAKIDFSYNQNDVPSFGNIIGLYPDRLYYSGPELLITSNKSPSINSSPYIYLSVNNYHNFDVFNSVNKDKGVTFIINDYQDNKEQVVEFKNGIHISNFNIKLYDFYGDILDLGNKEYYVELKVESNILNY